jgi:hypothetical protein
MKFALVSIFVGAAVAVQEHPIVDVVSMIKGLQDKVKEEAATEEITFTKFDHWCTNSVKTLDKAIAEEKAQIEVLTEEISAKTKSIEVLGKQIAGLEAEIMEMEAASAEADTLRGKTAKASEDAQTDYDGTIDAIKQALAAMEGAQSSTDVGMIQARQRVQKALNLAGLSVTEHQRSSLESFIQMGDLPAAPAPAARPDQLAAGDYEEHVKEYSFKSGSVIELLKGLLTKFEDEKLAATKEETNSLNAYDLSSQSREAAKEAATDSKNAKAAEKSTVEGEKVAAEADLEETQNDLEADSTSLSDTQQQCALKTSEWNERSSVRTNELEAMTAAIKILEKVAGVRTEAPENPIPPASPVSFIQLPDSDPRNNVVQLLRKEAHQVHSKALERLAQEISVHSLKQTPGSDSPFAQVNNMIEKMVFRLMNEQKEEDTHKNWCDAELSKSNASKTNKEDKIAMLTAKIDANTATITLLTEEIASNADMISSIEVHMAEAKDIRELGNKENAVSVKDSQDAQTALAEATAVLESFYKESKMVPKEAWESFAQRGVDLPAEPSTWEASYTGVADPKAPEGILSLLKEVSAKFAQMEADTNAQEASDKAAYDEDMKACDIEKARRVKESEMKDAEKKRLVEKVASQTKTRKQTSTALEAVEQYISDLQPACVEGDSTYEQRKADRQKEIDALHEAEAMLANAFAAPAPAPSAAFLSVVRNH